MSFFFFQAEDGIRDHCVTGVQTCALPIFGGAEELRELRFRRRSSSAIRSSWLATRSPSRRICSSIRSSTATTTSRPCPKTASASARSTPRGFAAPALCPPNQLNAYNPVSEAQVEIVVGCIDPPLVERTHSPRSLGAEDESRGGDVVA